MHSKQSKWIKYSEQNFYVSYWNQILYENSNCWLSPEVCVYTRAASLAAGRALGFHAAVRVALVCKAGYKLWLLILVIQIYIHI